MVEPSVIHAALDGGLVGIAGPFDLTNPATSIVVPVVQGRLYEMTSGQRTFGEGIAREFGVLLDEEYAYQEGRLRIGSALVEDPTNSRENLFNLAVWEGTRSSLVIGSYEATTSSLIGLLGLLTFAEFKEGLTVAPVDSKEISLARRGGRQPTVAKWVPGLGLLEIWERTAEADLELPPWAGAEVEGGELFAEADLGDRTLYILVGDTSVSRIYSDQSFELKEVTAGLENLLVNWRPVATSRQLS